MADKWLMAGDNLDGIANHTGSTPWVGETWVPQWDDHEIIRIHQIDIWIRWKVGVSVDRGVQILMLNRPWDWRKLAPASSSINYIQEYRSNLLYWLYEQYSTDTGGKTRTGMYHWALPFPVAREAKAVTFALRAVTNDPINQAWTRINYDRKRLTAHEFDLFLLENSRLMNAADPLGRMGYHAV